MEQSTTCLTMNDPFYLFDYLSIYGLYHLLESIESIESFVISYIIKLCHRCIRLILNMIRKHNNLK